MRYLTNALTFILGIIVGLLIELILAIIFEDKARKIILKNKRRLEWIISRLRSDSFIHSREKFRIGKQVVDCIVLEGAPRKPFMHGDITCALDSGELRLPNDFADILTGIRNEQQRLKERNGFALYHNGPMVAFISFIRSRTPRIEDPLLRLNFQRTDYYSFLATALSLDKSINTEGGPISVREKYLRGIDYENPIPFLATSFGINLAIITKDNHMILVKRGSRGISIYPDRWIVPISECVNPDKDINEQGNIDIFLTAIRGAKEEAGLDIQQDQIHFFSLCADTQWYLYGMTGMIRSESLTKDDVISRRSTGLFDKWEAHAAEAVEFNPKTIAKAISQTGGPQCWHPTSFAAIVQSLKHEFSDKEVEQAFSKTQ